MHKLRILPLIWLAALLGGCDRAPDEGGEAGRAAAPPPPPMERLQQTATADAEAAIAAALAGDHRSEAHRGRDRYRHPAETLRFFGLEPGMTVIELWPGGGWYTEVLAPVLRDQGQLIAAAFPPDSEIEYFRRVQADYERKLANDPGVYANVKVIPFQPPAHNRLGPPGSADMVLTFRNLHNWQKAGTLETVFRAAYEALRPGGVFGVVEHRAAPGTPLEEAVEAGYMPEDYVIELAERVGFRFEARSEINANPADTRDHPEGVWTLPPTLRLGQQDREKYLAIGESDRMTLKFVKPETE